LLAVKSISGQLGIHDMSEKVSEIWGPAAQSMQEARDRLASDWQPTCRHCMSCWHHIYMRAWCRRGVRLSVALLCCLVPTLYLSWWTMDGSCGWDAELSEFWVGCLVYSECEERSEIRRWSEPGKGKAAFSFCVTACGANA
jgi:hypothetical protein